MNKFIKIIIVGVISVLLLCACGGKNFRCAICMEKVTQVPHEVTVLGQEVEICDSCYKMLK